MRPILLDIPEQLSTARLLLRIPRAGDGAIQYPVVRESIPRIKQWLAWAQDDYAQENSEEWCRKAAAEFFSREAIHYFIFFKDQPDYLGTVSSFKFDWDIPKCEIGYWLRPTHHGRGIMTEAANGLIDFLKQSPGIRRFEVRADVLNLKSRRVAERLGFDLEGTLRSDFREKDGRLRDTCIYGLVQKSNS